jgi:hypothetical protein
MIMIDHRASLPYPPIIPQTTANLLPFFHKDGVERALSRTGTWVMGSFGRSSRKELYADPVMSGRTQHADARRRRVPSPVIGA